VNSPVRIGILGGTFDPIHNIHLHMARAARDFGRLDKVLFVVASQPPHKRGGVSASPHDRLAMVEAAIAEEPAFEACRLELDRPGPSYTADTLNQLRERYPSAEFFLILGQDALADLPNWRQPEAILQHCRLLVLRRSLANAPTDPILEGRFDFVPFETSDLSSTEVRRRLETGDVVAGLVPDAVANVITARGLYHGTA